MTIEYASEPHTRHEVKSYPLFVDVDVGTANVIVVLLHDNIGSNPL